MSDRVYLYITPFFPSPTTWRGGYCLDAAKALIRDGRFDVRVITFGGGADYEWDGVKVASVRRIVAPSGIFPFWINVINNWLLKKKLKSIGIRLSDVYVCHANTLNCGNYAAYLKSHNPRLKSIIQMHSSFSLSLSSGRLGVIPIHATLLYLYYRKLCEKVDLLLFVSKKSQETFGLQYVGAPEGEKVDVRNSLLLGRFIRPMKLCKQSVVYNGIDKERFSPRRIEHTGYVVGCVANFQPLKSQITLLKAANILKRKIPGLKIRLIGSGETLNECRGYAEKNGLNAIVTFEHEIDHRDLPDFYRSLDLFVLPSRLEGFACVCVESQACGTPVLATSEISFAEVLPESDREKWLFKPLDSQELAERIYCNWKNQGKQVLSINLDINDLWRDFLDRIG